MSSSDPSIPYPSPASNASAPAWVRNVKPYISPACAASVPDPFMCASVPNAYKASKVPTIVSNNAFVSLTAVSPAASPVDAADVGCVVDLI